MTDQPTTPRTAPALDDATRLRIATATPTTTYRARPNSTHLPDDIKAKMCRNILRGDPMSRESTHNPFAELTDLGSVDLPEGYRWATEDEMERPDAIVVPRTCDRNGTPYTEDEADVAVPYTDAEAADAAAVNDRITIVAREIKADPDRPVADAPSATRPAGERAYVPGRWN